MSFNPRLKELGNSDLKVPNPKDPAVEGWLTTHYCYLLVDVEGVTYEKRIQIPINARNAESLGWSIAT